MTLKSKLQVGKLLTTYIPMLCAAITVVHSIFDFIEVYLNIFSY